MTKKNKATLVLPKDKTLGAKELIAFVEREVFREHDPQDLHVQSELPNGTCFYLYPVDFLIRVIQVIPPKTQNLVVAFAMPESPSADWKKVYQAESGRGVTVKGKRNLESFFELWKQDPVAVKFNGNQVYDNHWSVWWAIKLLLLGANSPRVGSISDEHRRFSKIGLQLLDVAEPNAVQVVFQGALSRRYHDGFSPSFEVEG